MLLKIGRFIARFQAPQKAVRQGRDIAWDAQNPIEAVTRSVSHGSIKPTQRTAARFGNIGCRYLLVPFPAAYEYRIDVRPERANHMVDQ
ncbi:hypothetical protein NX02_02025 [Sphingomonas sanxanigenens DSM 19645 = NX02]|uniref:Uncharacterized protein n=1 Tax=Sphingomonas sanxanigenens DSM 19645 = NX02 TaxID=1123269 RepID=W0A549_9SPHN|nr:hypothetical protein NX02_02025 [Sphingomonas sanxanigenens DSM 19645 = NX02]